MIDLNKLLDEDAYLSYLNQLQGREIELVCKNYPHHNATSLSMSQNMLLKTRLFLIQRLGLDKDFSKINSLLLKDRLPKTQDDLTIYTFTFKDLVPKIMVERESAESFKELGIGDMKLSSFCLEYLNQHINFNGIKLKPEELPDLIERARVLERKNYLLFDRFLEFIEEYNLYFDYDHMEFNYTLK